MKLKEITHLAKEKKPLLYSLGKQLSLGRKLIRGQFQVGVQLEQKIEKEKNKFEKTGKQNCIKEIIVKLLG